MLPKKPCVVQESQHQYPKRTDAEDRDDRDASTPSDVLRDDWIGSVHLRSNSHMHAAPGRGSQERPVRSNTCHQL
jgi:hypothetical protein